MFIPEEDRGHSDMPRLAVKIIKIKERDNTPTRYTLASVYGVIDCNYCARDLEPYVGILTIEPSALDKKLCLRSAASLASDHTGTLTANCNCKTDCLSNRCACKKANQKCSSHCHSLTESKKRLCCLNRENK